MNELLMQRCVDGEMTSAERGDFLASLGEHVVQWKQLACRLLDERELEAGCREWITDISTPNFMTNRVARISSAESMDHELNGHASSNGMAASIGYAVGRADEAASTMKASPTPRGVKSNMALVVVGLLGIAIGLGLSGVWNDDGAGRNLADGVSGDQSHDKSHTDASLADVPEAPAFSTILLMLDTPDGPQQFEVPVVRSGDLITLASMESSISPEVREQLSRRGLQPTEIPGVIKLPIDDATSVAVPVHAVQVQSVAL